ncbi:MAG: hypothetical protein HQM08_27305 [Candidatus Riflebacteria bacterium]|nr:hypothetical protein [Candidatus Riflebacteria bacterium]
MEKSGSVFGLAKIEVSLNHGCMSFSEISTKGRQAGQIFTEKENAEASATGGI